MDPGADPLAALLLISASVASKHFKQSSSTSTARYLLAATCMIAVQVYQARMVLSLPVWMGQNIGRPLRNLQFPCAQIQPIPVRLPLCAFMHRVWSMSGEQLAAVSVDKVRSGVHLKGFLRILHGFPLCMQRLLYKGQLLHNWIELTAPIDVQLILQPLSTDLQQHTAAQELVTFACKHGKLQMAQMLVEAGAHRYGLAGNAALLCAAENGHVEIVQLLVEASVDKNIRGEYGQTALMLAAQKGHVEVARQLLEAGVDKDLQDHCGNTALWYASQRGHIRVAELLMEAVSASSPPKGISQ